MLKKLGLVVIAVIVIVISANYYYKHKSDKVIEASYPIDTVEFNINTIIINISNDAKISDIFNLDLFNGIAPYLSEEEIINHLGKPNNIEFIEGTEVNTYYTKYGRIETGVVFDELSNFTFCNFYSRKLEYSMFLKPQLLKILPKNLSNKIIVGRSKNEGEIIIQLSDENEDIIHWSDE